MAILDLLLLLNPEKPLSLANSISQNISMHSLGWIATSVKPVIAHAMTSLSIDKVTEENCHSNDNARKNVSLVINAMSGEGTIELESQNDKTHSFFMISGDKNRVAAAQTAARLYELNNNNNTSALKSRTRPLVDMVIWDAQNIPLRDDIADVFLADLPFAGSTKKIHQEPSCTKKSEHISLSTKSSSSPSLDYRRVMTQAIQVMRSGGTAALLSTDTKALGHAIGGLHWSTVTKICGINVGGLSGQLSLMKKHQPSFKDLSMWVTNDTLDLCSILLRYAEKAICKFYLDDNLKMRELSIDDDDDNTRSQNNIRCGHNNGNTFKNLVVSVQLHDSFYHEKKRMFSQCYRFWFDGLVTNIQAKTLEQYIRDAVANKLPEGVIELR
uniref:Uncharacterized protein n=1 Tax=Ditylum brightwellii TaxID=49249 RepID=A0A7S4TA84_9STRA